ncbi:TraR/DksA family transcriptional regulator [Halopseudomonas pelagia]|uniref:TraR/DksA family transcriptional regulator n=1 Tax=Halopseudomonas pelagia TaxID=553151 RepID=UPI0003A4EF49|nr:TraR/DksA C4-type zinc finger protein [Halopseudomonas pelagia]|tara:strand:- start:40 stop:354 length:315 start_codon:yes stop_codon:yes gene_type:complete
MHDNPLQTLEHLREEYLQRQAALSRDLAAAHSADSAEQAQERENDEVMRALLQEADQSLQQVDAAIRRYHAGQYGLCTRCSESIGAERLHALPATDTCITCAEV